MNYNEIIKMIVLKFNENFHTNYRIVFNTRDNILNSNPSFSISKSAGGFYDNKTKTIYLFTCLFLKQCFCNHVEEVLNQID